jgi:ribosomal protein S18 acetylase RimI-like enzyme
MLIRELTAADARPYWDLRLRALKESPTAFGSTPEETLNRTLEERIARFQTEMIAPPEVNYIIGAFDQEERLVGTAGFRREGRIKTRHKATVWGVYVAPEARGSGAGRGMMTALLNRARTLEGLRQVNLIVTYGNQAAKGLYTSLGFQTYGIEKDALRQGDTFLDDEYMVLFL